jgi:hypothetical protein
MNAKMKNKTFSAKGLLVSFAVALIAFFLLLFLAAALLKSVMQFERFYSVTLYVVFAVLAFVVAFVNRLGGGGVLLSLLVSLAVSLLFFAIGLVAGNHISIFDLLIRYLLFSFLSVLFSYLLQMKKKGKHKKKKFPLK